MMLLAGLSGGVTNRKDQMVPSVVNREEASVEARPLWIAWVTP
jgi:hypothetical protein